MDGPERRTVELTLDGAIELAIVLQKNGRLAGAADLFGHVLDRAPDHPRALHYAGVLAHQQGRSDEAVALIERSLGLEPGNADATATWVSSISRRARCGRRGVPTCDCRRAAACQRPQQSRRAAAPTRRGDAEAEYRAAIALEPDHVDAYEPRDPAQQPEPF